MYIQVEDVEGDGFSAEFVDLDGGAWYIHNASLVRFDGVGDIEINLYLKRKAESGKDVQTLEDHRARLTTELADIQAAIREITGSGQRNFFDDLGNRGSNA